LEKKRSKPARGKRRIVLERVIKKVVEPLVGKASLLSKSGIFEGKQRGLSQKRRSPGLTENQKLEEGKEVL